MSFDSGEVGGNGPIKNFAICPFCGQKLLNVASLRGEAEVVVKCRRCYRFIRVRMTP